MNIDRRSGATTVAEQAAGKLVEWLSKYKNHSLNHVLSRLEDRCLRLLCDYPAMGNIYSLINAVGTGIDRAAKETRYKSDFTREIVQVIKRWQREELKACQTIPKFAAKTIGPAKTILTVSSSELVCQTILRLKSRRVKAIVLESRPLREGELTAYSLARLGIPTTLITDLAFHSFEKDVDAVLVGADRIGKTLVNKAGSRALLEWAKSRKKPVFIVCQTSKFVPYSWCLLPLPAAPSHEVSLLKHPKLRVSNFYFEEVPLGLVNAVVTEKGRFSGKNLERRVVSAKTSSWFGSLLKKVAARQQHAHTF